MPIDPSIPLQAGQGVAPPPNLLDTFGKYQGIANAMSMNDAIKANTAQTQQTTAQSGSSYAMRQLAALAQLPDGVRNQAAARALVGHLDEMHLMPPGMAQVWNDKINATTNQAGLDQLIALAGNASMAPEGAAASAYGTPNTRNTGGTLKPGMTPSGMSLRLNPGQPGFIPTGGDATLTASPDHAAGITRIENPDGSYSTVGNTKIMEQTGVPGLIPDGARPSIPATPTSMGNGTYSDLPPALRGPGRTPAPATTPPAARPLPPGVISTGITPGARTAAETGAGADTNQFNAIATTAAAAKATGSILSNMEAQLKGFTSGAGAGGTLATKAALQSALNAIYPNLASSLGIDPDKITSQQVFDKLSAQLISMGAVPTDAKLSLAGIANPTAHLTPGALSEILHNLQGTLDYHQAINTLATKRPNGQSFPEFQSQTGSNLDPTLFQYNRMDGSQKRAMLSAMPNQRAFIDNYMNAQKSGVFNGGR